MAEGDMVFKACAMTEGRSRNLAAGWKMFEMQVIAGQSSLQGFLLSIMSQPYE